MIVVCVFGGKQKDDKTESCERLQMDVLFETK